MVVRQKKDINRRKRKLTDLVQAYKTLTTSKEKVEAALEKQQDTTTRRTKELKDMHKKDTEAKDKLAEVFFLKSNGSCDILMMIISYFLYMDIFRA